MKVLSYYKQKLGVLTIIFLLISILTLQAYREYPIVFPFVPHCSLDNFKPTYPILYDTIFRPNPISVKQPSCLGYHKPIILPNGDIDMNTGISYPAPETFDTEVMDIFILTSIITFLVSFLNICILIYLSKRKKNAPSI